MPRGQKLVVQMVETFREHMQPAFVEQLDAWAAGGKRRHGAAAGHDLRRRRDPHPHRGRHRQPAAVPQRRGARAGDSRRRRLHAGGPGARPRAQSRTCASAASSAAPRILASTQRMATRDLLAARSIKDLVRASGGLYRPAEALSQLVSGASAAPTRVGMEHLDYRFTGGQPVSQGRARLVGVVGSGNLEVLIEPQPARWRVHRRRQYRRARASARSGRR